MREYLRGRRLASVVQRMDNWVIHYPVDQELIILVDNVYLILLLSDEYRHPLFEEPMFK